MKELRIGIIGCGTISHRHMITWPTIPEAKVVAAAEIDPQKRKAWGEKYGFAECDLYADFRELLKREDIDAVDVCVHNNLHTPIAIEVLKAGKHCYSEKPMAGSYADAKLLYDAGRTIGPKLAIQLSSLFTYQTRKAKQMVASGELGEVYHGRIYNAGFARRPGLDAPGQTPDFYNRQIAGRGPFFDIGVYHISQMLYIAGMPELESVYGASYNKCHRDERMLRGREYGVEDLGVGLARFTNGFSLDICEAWAFNNEIAPYSLIGGTEGGLKITGTDTYGGEVVLRALSGVLPAGFARPELSFIGFRGNEQYEMKLRCQENQAAEVWADPAMAAFNNNQAQWAAYLRGELTDETRVDTPYIAMQTALVSDGVFLSDQLRRSVTREEIEQLSVSNAIRHQQTPWGTFDYEF